MSLPCAWVDKLFQKFSVTYGQGFLRQYDGVPIEEVKANWGEELSGFQQNPAAISYGLDHLPPSKAPTVLEFRDICRKQPLPAFAALAAPTDPVDPSVLARARKAVKSNASPGGRAWAYALRQRELDSGGKGMTPFQRAAWREAIPNEVTQ